MARTKGSGWGGGVILYQLCPNCGKKKMYYKQPMIPDLPDFYCTYCKQLDNGIGLIRERYSRENRNSHIGEANK